MDPFTMAGLVLGRLELTSEQLAQLRAINTKYFTEIAALGRRGDGEAGAAQPTPSARDMAALHATIASDIRDLLTEEQRVLFDRNLPRVWAREIEPAIEANPDGAP